MTNIPNYADTETWHTCSSEGDDISDPRDRAGFDETGVTSKFYETKIHNCTAYRYPAMNTTLCFFNFQGPGSAGDPEWIYRILTDDEIMTALAELDKRFIDEFGDDDE